MAREQAREIAHEKLAQVGLTEIGTLYPAELSAANGGLAGPSPATRNVLLMSRPPGSTRSWPM